MTPLPASVPPLSVEDAEKLREFIELVRGLGDSIDLDDAESLEGASDLAHVTRYWYEIVLEKSPGDRSLPDLLKEFSQLTDEDLARYLKG